MFWTIEETADHLGLTVTQVRESRRKGEWPGNVGKLRGRRLAFNAELIEAGPPVAQTTEDVSEAILWTLQGIEEKVAEMAKDIAAYKCVSLAEAVELMRSYYFGEITTTTGEEEE